tara:strand:- start:309 stop:491 length:183 start_codon:yes stop_codon:yes gene_type:complete
MNFRNHLPYFLLIAIYFFFVNLEARNDKFNTLNNNEKTIPVEKRIEEKNIRIKIPVIPYN